MLTLRDYQQEAIDSIFDYWSTGKGKHPLVVAPTGSGKSLIIAEFCRRVCTSWPSVRIMVVTDSRELVAQNEKELRALYPEASTGIYSAGLGKRQTQAQITFAGIQSVYNRVFDMGKQDIIIIDECFPYDTTVVTNKGILKIGDIVKNKLDVLVLTHKGNWKHILSHIEKKIPSSMVCVVHEYGTVECTQNHRFLTSNRGWVHAKDLNERDCIYYYNDTSNTRTPKQRIESQMGKTIERAAACNCNGICKEEERVASRIFFDTNAETDNIRKPNGRYVDRLPNRMQQLSPSYNSPLFKTSRICGLEIYNAEKPVPFTTEAGSEQRIWRDELQGAKSMPSMSNGNIQHCENRWKNTVHAAMVRLDNRANRFRRMVFGRWFNNNERTEHKYLYGKGINRRSNSGCIMAGKSVGVESDCVSRTQRIQNRNIQTARRCNGTRDFDVCRDNAANNDVQNSVYDLEIEDDHTYTANGIIVHNCHMISREHNTRYGQFLKDMSVANPDMCVLGLTATPYRMDSGMLHEGKDRLFDGIAHVSDLKRLIKDKYLVPVVSKGGVCKIDLSDVHIQMGEYKSNELAYAADDPELVRLAVEEIVEYGKERKAWLIFAAGVEHAEHVANEIRKHNIQCEIVTGETPNDERDEIVNRFRDGKLKALINVGVFTKGFNAPICDLIALLMATKSTGKYVQIVGRGLRTYEGKENCLLLDYGNNVREHGPIDEVDPIKRKNAFCMEVKAAPMKECPQCHLIVHTRVTVCSCGYEFPIIAPHGTQAYDGAVLSGQVKPEIVPIAGVWFSRHKKTGKPDSVKVTFYTALDKEYYCWLGLDADGYYKEKSLAIVKRFGGKATTVKDALQESEHWRKPIAIQVKPRGKFFDVLGIIFDNKPHTIQQGIA